jgi:hypothetical protein
MESTQAFARFRPMLGRWPLWVGLAAVLLPVLLLGSERRGMAEYFINVWFLGYHTEYFRDHLTFPTTYETEELVGGAVPLFYGSIIYKAGGLIGLVVGPHWAFRLLVLFALTAVYVGVRATTKRLGASEALATLTTCAVVWANYSFTNLYSRCAFCEFTAVSMLICSCCLWAQFFLRPRVTGNLFTALAAGFFLAIAMAIHPITAMFAVPVFAALYVQWMLQVPDRPNLGRRHLHLLAGLAPVCVILGPWLYTYSKLQALTGFHFGCLLNIDGDFETTLLTRLYPVPADPRDLTHQKDFPVKHLDLQVNLPLLLILGVLLVGAVRASRWRDRIRLAVVLGPGALLGAVAFAACVDPRPDDFPSLFWKAQFSYRYINLVNVCGLIVLLSVLYQRSSTPVGPGPRTVGMPRVAFVLIALLTVVNFGLKMKKSSELVVRTAIPTARGEPEYRNWLLRCPSKLVFAAYRTAHMVDKQNTVEEASVSQQPFLIGRDREFGKVMPLRVSAARDEYVGTNAYPLLWSTLRVDGDPVPAEQLRYWNDAQPTPSDFARVAVPVPAGEHTIEYATEPPLVWVVLNRACELVFVAWLGVLIGYYAPRFVRQVVGQTQVETQTAQLPPADLVRRAA